LAVPAVGAAKFFDFDGVSNTHQKRSPVTLTILFVLYLTNPMLDISFTNIQHAKGTLYIGVYNSEADFLKPEEAVLKKIVPVTVTGSLDLRFPELAPGVYALSCFHDLNGNGKLDTNLFGIPTEPYGFSNNARPKFRAPNWAEAKFEVKEGGGRISVKLEKW